ncbi:MAG: hypothetical protein ABL996_19120 [Micropepsaceae bacterium]
MTREEIVAAIVSAAGGALTARVRLQKAAYFLEELGLGSGFGFEYHHYGPYSRDLDNAIADAKASKLVKEAIHYRDSDGASYSVFEITGGVSPAHVGTLDRTTAAKVLARFNEANITVLELAATMHWLWKHEKRADWQDEAIRRKARKATAERVESAKALLADLQLLPAARAA